MKKIGVMGCGVVADFGHVPAILQTPGLQLSALYDPIIERAQMLARKYEISTATDDIETFFAAHLDAVAITSSAPAHRQNLEDAARRKVSVLCEKPLALNEDDIETMIVTMHEARLPFYAGFCYRFSPCALQIKQMVDDGVIGDVRSLRLVYTWNLHGRYEPGPDGVWRENARRVGRMLEGGPMVDCGVHQIDLARWWLGSEVVHQTGVGAWVEEYAAPDHAYLHLDHANGAHTMVEMSFTFGHTVRDPLSQFQYQLIGTDGLILYDRDTHRFEVRHPLGTELLPWHDEKNFTEMYAAFARALETGEDGPLPTGLDGLIATRIARLGTEQAIAARPPVTRAMRPSHYSFPDDV